MAGQGSARVTLKEIDLSQVRDPQQLPNGVPAAVVGTARKGPAFVPRTFANIQQFEAVFGSMSEKHKDSNSNRLGPIAINEWLRSADAGTFLRVLGVGNGKKASGGSTTDAGFLVGEKLVHAVDGSLGVVGNNPYAAGTAPLGKVQFLGCFMQDTANSDFLKNTAFSNVDSDAAPVIRGVLMTPQGVVAALNPNNLLDSTADVLISIGVAGVDIDTHVRIDPEGKSFGKNLTTNLVGYPIGEVSAEGAFKLILNGFSNTAAPAVIDCSFDPNSPSYISKVLNTDPTKIEELGHYLYTWWDIDPEVAVVSSTGLQHGGNALGTADTSAANYDNMTGFLLEGAEFDNYKNFTDKFKTAKTPWIVSQHFGGKEFKLFRLHALDDGEIGNQQFRLLISDLNYVNDETYGSFTLSLEKIDSDPVEGEVIATWKSLSLDPDSRNYIARVIGDQHIYFDFENAEDKQRLVVDGDYEVKNNFVRIELSSDLKNGNVQKGALPTGFLSHALVQTAIDNNFVEPFSNGTEVFDDGGTLISTAQVAPIKFVNSISRNVAEATPEASADLAWGVKFAKKLNDDSVPKELGEIEYDASTLSYAKYFPTFNGVLLEDDGTKADAAFQNGRFSLENIKLESSSFDGATYDYGTRADTTHVQIARDAKGGNKYLKFRCMFQGGFDGVNIFDKEKRDLTSAASLREANDEGGVNVFTGPTVRAYQKAVDVLSDKSAAEFQLLAIPGQRADVVTNYALSACEERFDALYIMDITERDASDVIIESAAAKPHVRNTIAGFEGRGVNSSFGAAYFPDVFYRRADGVTTKVAPSVGLLGVMARNDRIAAPWFAPAGLNRGRVSASNVAVQMNRDLLDELYDADINPIYEPAGRSGEVYVFGQKTLLQDESALDRINVRRLLIDIRRKVKKIGEQLLFEPNRESTLARFASLVEPIMQDVQKRQGVARYKVQIDSSTTTQNDIENNTVRGKIYLQPLKSIEFISLDFVVTNTIQ